MTRALVVIDVQESFRQRPLWQAISNSGIARDVARLVEAARGAGDLVVSDLGYEVTFAVDATATNPIARPGAPEMTVDELLADPRTLPADAVIERTVYALAGRFATIRTVAELTG